MHITEVLSENQYEELHLCEQCATKFFYDTQPKTGSASKGAIMESLEEAGLGHQECPTCGIKFVEFRNTGRLGCPHDYTTFREDLMPLLENIHGDTKHVGKSPKRLPKLRATESELAQLRGKLKQAVTKEDYEEAAKIRDKIRHLEEVS